MLRFWGQYGRIKRKGGGAVKRLFLMLLVSGVILGFTMHYRTDSMYDRGKEDAFRQGYLVGQADAASATNNVPTDEAASATESDTANANASATGDTSEIGGTLAEDTSATGAASAAGSALATGRASETGDTSATGSTPATGSASEAGDTSTTETSGEASVATEAQTYLSQGYYVVQKGDSLVGICKKIYQTTAMLDKLCEVNGIEDQDSIYAGQYLTLPN